MIIPESILQATVGKALYKALDAYRVYEVEMPWVYQIANPEGRPDHGDWTFFKETPRRNCARKVPLPYKIISGPSTKSWLDFDPAYPMPPDVESRHLDDGAFQVLADRGGYGLCTYAAFINGEWRPVFKKYMKQISIFGTKYRFSWYVGLHQDNHWADLMCYIEPFAMSLVKEI